LRAYLILTISNATLTIVIEALTIVFKRLTVCIVTSTVVLKALTNDIAPLTTGGVLQTDCSETLTIVLMSPSIVGAAVPIVYGTKSIDIEASSIVRASATKSLGHRQLSAPQG